MSEETPEEKRLRVEERRRIRARILAEIEDHDPDSAFRELSGTRQAGQDEPGLAGNAWWRSYCHVGGLLAALACVEQIGGEQ